jgi:hypothetical protein
LGFRAVPVLPLIALVFWMTALGAVAAIVIKGVLPSFKSLVMAIG